VQGLGQPRPQVEGGDPLGHHLALPDIESVGQPGMDIQEARVGLDVGRRLLHCRPHLVPRPAYELAEATLVSDGVMVDRAPFRPQSRVPGRISGWRF